MSIGEEQLFKAVQDLLDECQKQDVKLKRSHKMLQINKKLLLHNY